MLIYQHKGRALNLPLNVAGLTGDANVDSLSTYIQGLVGGRAVCMTPTGVALADNAAVATAHVIGFLVNDAAGYFYENKPALASGLVAVCHGAENAIITDQIDPALTFAPGDMVYASTGAKAGLVTNVAPAANAFPVGIATSAASVAAPQLTVVLL